MSETKLMPGHNISLNRLSLRRSHETLLELQQG